MNDVNRRFLIAASLAAALCAACSESGPAASSDVREADDAGAATMDASPTDAANDAAAPDADAHDDTEVDPYLTFVDPDERDARLERWEGTIWEGYTWMCEPTTAALAYLDQLQAEGVVVSVGGVDCFNDFEFAAALVYRSTGGVSSYFYLTYLGQVLDYVEEGPWHRAASRARYGAADVHIAHIMGTELADDPIPMTIDLFFSTSDEERQRVGEFGRLFGAEDSEFEDNPSDTIGPITLSVNEAEQYFIWDDAVQNVRYTPPRPSQPREYAVPSWNSATATRSRPFLQSPSIDARAGSGTRIGVSELGPVAAWHEAFSSVPRWVTRGERDLCDSATCPADSHATAVASRVSAERLHAAKATIVLDGTPEDPTLTENLRARLEWFSNQGVVAINMSHQVEPDPVPGDINELSYSRNSARLDNLARQQGVLPVLAAQNVGRYIRGRSVESCSVESFNGRALEAECLAANALCVGGVRHAGPDRMYSTAEVYTGSGWRNFAEGGIGTRAFERPDVVSESFGVAVATTRSEDSWTDPEEGMARDPMDWLCTEEPRLPRLPEFAVGTSFATPSVTGLVALLNSCRVANGHPQLEPFEARAMIRNAAVPFDRMNRADAFATPGWLEDDHAPYAYPTPRFEASENGRVGRLLTDYRAGTGMADALLLADYCDTLKKTEGDDIGSPRAPQPRTSFAGSNTRNAESLFDWRVLPREFHDRMSDADVQRESDENSAAPDDEGKFRTAEQALFLADTEPGEIEMQLLEMYANVQPGSRIRASISFMNCGDGDPEAAVDYDLAAVNPDTGQFLAWSRSLVDTNEGFDIIVQEQHQRVEVVVLRPKSDGPATRCTDPADRWVAAGLDEPYGFAVTYWPAVDDLSGIGRP